jgi:hypothetical protein
MARFGYARSLHLGFLGASPIRFEIPNYSYWIFLDFLGFSRSNRDFSTGYAERTAEDISHALPRIESAGTGASGLVMRKRKLFMGQA